MERISDEELDTLICKASKIYEAAESLNFVNRQSKNLLALQELKERRSAGGEWISVKDRLPEIGEEVIVYTPNYRANITALCRLIRYEGATDFFWDNFYGGNNFHLKEAVTHWMPLPEPPNKGDE